jgi:hypothetical protein
MKRVLFAVFCLMFLLTGWLLANTRDDIWLVHKAEYPPAIDGEFDEIWHSASRERIIVPDAAEGTAPEDYLDCYGLGYMMWDDDNLYILVKVVDDEMSTGSTNTYENDGVEYYFDGDNSKVVGPPYDGFDDVQCRIEYTDGDDESLYENFPAGTEGATAEWESTRGDEIGYIIECSIPLAGINVEYGNIFGFDLQINDGTNDVRESMLRWWSDNNNEWQDASLFGEAELIDYVASDIMNIYQMNTPPTLDGEYDAAWDDIPYIGMNTYVETGGDYVQVYEWWDADMQFKIGWDPDNIYLWLEVWDDEIDMDETAAHVNDAVELMWDGGNEKATSYDDNDIQQRWIWGMDVHQQNAENSTPMWGEMDIDYSNYTLELAVPASDLPFTLDEGAEVGFELQVNDRDNGVRETIMRWWGNDDASWANPSLFGTVLLTGPVAVNQIDQPESFMLSQNYPNPFNPTTHINFNLDRRSQVRLTVYDVLGNMVADLVNDVQSSGAHTVAFDGSNLTSGVYFYKLETPTEVVTKKMMLLK